MNPKLPPKTDELRMKDVNFDRTQFILVASEVQVFIPYSY